MNDLADLHDLTYSARLSQTTTVKEPIVYGHAGLGIEE